MCLTPLFFPGFYTLWDSWETVVNDSTMKIIQDYNVYIICGSLFLIIYYRCDIYFHIIAPIQASLFMLNSCFGGGGVFVRMARSDLVDIGKLHTVYHNTIWLQCSCWFYFWKIYHGGASKSWGDCDSTAHFVCIFMLRPDLFSSHFVFQEYLSARKGKSIRTLILAIIRFYDIASPYSHDKINPFITNKIGYHCVSCTILHSKITDLKQSIH